MIKNNKKTENYDLVKISVPCLALIGLTNRSYLYSKLYVDTHAMVNAILRPLTVLMRSTAYTFSDDRRRDRRRRRRRNRIRGNNSAASGTETDTSVSNYRQDRGPRQPPASRGGPNRPGQVKSEDNATQSLATANGAGGRNSHPTANGGGGEDGSAKASKSDSQQSAPKEQRPVRRPPPIPSSAQSKAGGNQLSGSDSDTKAKGKTGNAPKSKEHIVNGE